MSPLMSYNFYANNHSDTELTDPTQTVNSCDISGDYKYQYE